MRSDGAGLSRPEGATVKNPPPPAVCTCDHADLDPTPRPSHGQYSPLKNVAKVSAGLTRSKQDVHRRKASEAAIQAVVAAAEQDAKYVSTSIAQMQASDGMALRTSSINFEQDLNCTSMGGSMGSLQIRPDHSASRASLDKWKEERRRGALGFSSIDVLIRHRQLMQRRASIGSTEVSCATEHESEAAALAQAQLERAARIRRMISAPTARFWWLLLLWTIGGPIGAHRASLGSWRVAALQLALVLVGAAFIVVAAFLLHPEHVPANRYLYKEAEYVTALAYSLAGLLMASWLRDGYVLISSRRRQRLVGAGHLQALKSSALQRRSQPSSASAIRGFSSTKDKVSNRALLWSWFLLGLPCCLHRWRMRHYSLAACHCVFVILSALVAIEGLQGTLEGAFRLCVIAGCALAGVSLVVWWRDLVQLLRCKLGPRDGAAAEYWILFASFIVGGSFGFHRLLLGRYRSAPLFALLSIFVAFFAVDATLGLTWKSLPPDGQLAVRVAEAAVAVIALVSLVIILGRDFSRLLRGMLCPCNEGLLHWQIVYSWLLGGLAFGLHRFVASKKSWPIFPILNMYGIGLFVVNAMLFRVREGDPNKDPSRFAIGTSICVDIIAGLCLFLSLSMWVSDLWSVSRGRLQYWEENVLFWKAFVVWLSPFGFIGRIATSEPSLTQHQCGFHFISHGRPYDWQLYCSLASIGGITGIAARQFASIGKVDETRLLMLIAGAACVGINFARFVMDGASMRTDSLLRRQLGTSAFYRVRRAWLFTGWLFSGHQWILRHRVCCFLTLLLHLIGIALLLGQPEDDSLISQRSDANGTSIAQAVRLPIGATLQQISVSLLLLLAGWWLIDGAMLACGRINLSGERLEIVEDDLDFAGTDVLEHDEAIKTSGGGKPLDPPPHWRKYRTSLGANYYYDPHTEFVHHLTASGCGNTAVDSKRNRTFTYSTLDELDAQIENAQYGWVPPTTDSSDQQV